MIVFKAFSNSSKPDWTNRAAEWVSALALMFIGLLVLVVGSITPVPVVGAFRDFANWGLDDNVTAAVFLAVGALRFAAVCKNGNWKYGPSLRVFGAFLGVIIYSILSFGIYQMFLESHSLFIAVGAWCALMIGEVFNFVRAIFDEKR